MCCLAERPDRFLKPVRSKLRYRCGEISKQFELTKIINSTQIHQKK